MKKIARNILAASFMCAALSACSSGALTDDDKKGQSSAQQTGEKTAHPTIQTSDLVSAAQTSANQTTPASSPIAALKKSFAQTCISTLGKEKQDLSSESLHATCDCIYEKVFASRSEQDLLSMSNTAIQTKKLPESVQEALKRAAPICVMKNIIPSKFG